MKPIIRPRSATDDHPLVKIVLGTIAISFIALFLFMPLLTVFSEALARGWQMARDALVEPDALLDRACEVAAELAAIPAACYAANKKLLRQPLVDRARQLTAAHGPALVEKWCSPETLKDVADFASRHIGRRA